MNFNLLLVFLIAGKVASFSSIQQRQNGKDEKVSRTKIIIIFIELNFFLVPFKIVGSYLDSDEINLQNSRAEEEDSENLDGRQQSVDIKDQSTSILVQILLYFS